MLEEKPNAQSHSVLILEGIQILQLPTTPAVVLHGMRWCNIGSGHEETPHLPNKCAPVAGGPILITTPGASRAIARLSSRMHSCKPQTAVGEPDRGPTTP